MFWVYITHKLGADKILEFATMQQANAWVSAQYEPNIFYIIDWGI